MKDKRGLSTIVTTLIMILLVLVSIGLVWVVVQNLIRGGLDSIGTGNIFVDLQIKEVSTDINGDLIVKVKRETGEGNVSGVLFLVSDGDNTESITKKIEISELSEKKFTISKSELGSIFFIKSVSVAPIIGTEAGKEKTGRETSIFKNNQIGIDTLTNDYGLISWWKMEGDAQDSVGTNHGFINGSDCSIQGKFGKGCEFTANSPEKININVNTINGIPLGSEWTISSWFEYPLPTTGTSWNTLVRGKTADHQILVQISSQTLGAFDNSGGTGFKPSGFIMSSLSNGWHQITAVQDGTNIIYYIDGIKVGEILGYTTSTDIYSIGNPSSTTFQGWGKADEFMYFDKALNPDQVKTLYELKL